MLSGVAQVPESCIAMLSGVGEVSGRPIAMLWRVSVFPEPSGALLPGVSGVGKLLVVDAFGTGSGGLASPGPARCRRSQREEGDWRPPGRQDAGAPSASLRDEEGGSGHYAGLYQAARGDDGGSCTLESPAVRGLLTETSPHQERRILLEYSRSPGSLVPPPSSTAFCVTSGSVCSFVL